MKSTDLYILANSLVGKHLTLDDSIDKSVGCAEAVSYVLKQFGINVPDKGIPGTAALCKFLEQSKSFQENTQGIFSSGMILLAETGTGNGKLRGHVGITTDKSTVLSNDSNTGFWTDHWTYKDWVAYYEGKGGIKSRLFTPVDPVKQDLTDIRNKLSEFYQNNKLPFFQGNTIKSAISKIDSVLKKL